MLHCRRYEQWHPQRGWARELQKRDRIAASALFDPGMSETGGVPRISVVVVAYNMARELPRVIYSLSTRMQRNIDASQYEVIVVHNGPKGRAPDDSLRQPGMQLRILDVQNPTVSPAPAVNLGLKHARGELVGVMIDGARIASPGLLANTLRAAHLHPRPVIATLGFHLGPDRQGRSIRAGLYSREIEDGLLASVEWEQDGYRLFRICALAGAAKRGWFRPITESNAFFMPRGMWVEHGGYDERFVTPGGGLVNPDAYRRACELSGSQLIILLGEGTFHQIHGGVITNATTTAPLQMFREEYRSIHHRDYSGPKQQQPWYFGDLSPEAYKFMTDIWRTGKDREQRAPAAEHRADA
jgi:hypothetical protein